MRRAPPLTRNAFLPYGEVYHGLAVGLLCGDHVEGQGAAAKDDKAKG